MNHRMSHRGRSIGDRAFGSGRVVGLLLAIVFVVVACGSGNGAGEVSAPNATQNEGTEQAEPAELRKVGHRLNWLPSGIQAFIYYGKELGIFEEEGFDLEILPGKGTVLAIEDLSAGNVEFAHASTGSVVLAIAQGREVMSIGTLYGLNSWGFFFSEDSDIQEAQDLKGKSILMTPGATESTLLEPVLSQVGLSASDVQLINVEAAAKLTSYAQGTGDAMVTAIPYGMPIVGPMRPSRTIAWADLGFQVPDYSFLASKKLVEEDPDFVRDYLRALYRSIEATRANPGAAVDALISANPELEGKHESMLQELAGTDKFDGYVDHVCSEAMAGMPVGRHAEADWEQTLQILSKYAGLEGELEFNRFATNQFFDEGEPVSSVTC